MTSLPSFLGVCGAGRALLCATAVVMVSSGFAQAPVVALRGFEVVQATERRLDTDGEMQSLAVQPLPVQSWSASTVNAKHSDQCGVQHAGYLPPGECKYDSPAWCPARASDTEWLQADMGTVVAATNVVVQGKYAADTWGAVTEYKLQYSVDGTSWHHVEQTMSGASSQNCGGEGMTKLAVLVLARFFRFTPTKWIHFPSMRAGVFGFPGEPKRLSVQSWSASSQNAKYQDQCGVQHAGYLSPGICKYDSPAWCPARASDTEWLQADMGMAITAARIVVQGKYAAETWGAVTEYTLQYSLDGVIWKRVDQALAGASSQNCGGEGEAVLAVPIQARFFRLAPTKWIHFPSMRVGIFGFAAF
jgi:hypothetical protein